MKRNPLARAAAVAGLLYLFLVGVNGLSSGFRALGEGVLDSFFAATANPFIGLMVGILSTTLMQSSSVTTAMIVGLVTAPVNPVPLANAVPKIMGANIGTTVTNTMASLAHIPRREEFRTPGAPGPARGADARLVSAHPPRSSWRPTADEGWEG